MPNWCYNQVDISGDSATIADLVKFVKGDDPADSGNDFAFRKIVPPPTGDIYSAGDTQNDFQCGCKKEWITTKEAVGEPMTEGFIPQEGYWAVNGVRVEKKPSEAPTIQGVMSEMFGGAEICPEHKVEQVRNHYDWWYNWNCANWGTKWDASDVYQVDYTEGDDATQYDFQTAWSPAEPVIQALSKKFPTLHIAHRYCEGGMGYAGEVIWEGGNEIHRQEFEQTDVPDEAWITDEDGENTWERDYERIPMTPFETFCDEHFGGVVGG